MKNSKHLALLVAGIAMLSACQTTTGKSGPIQRAEFRSEIPPELYDYGFGRAAAIKIHVACNELTFNSENASQAWKEIETSLKAKGYGKNDFKYFLRNPPKERLSSDFDDLIEARGIVIDDQETICAAGKKEMAEGSRVGIFLKEVDNHV